MPPAAGQLSMRTTTGDDDDDDDDDDDVYPEQHKRLDLPTIITQYRSVILVRPQNTRPRSV